MTQTTKTILLSILVSLAVCFLLINWMGLKPQQAASAKENAYERVTRTGVIRCGYGIWPPLIVKDPNTGKMSGTSVDIMEEIAKQIGVKLEWVEEVDWGQIGPALQSGRIDVMCSGLWGTAQRARGILFSTPLYFTPVQAFVRADDRRFDNNLAAINQPNIKISTNDGDVSEEIAVRDFPNAQRLAKVQLAGEGQLMLNVIQNKADITFSHISFVDGFNRNNDNALRRVELPAPLRVFPVVLGIAPNNIDMKNLMDAGIVYLSASGSLDKILDQYFADKPGWILKTDKPYQP